MRMFLAFIMAFIASVNLLTATESKPPKTLSIVTATSTLRELGSGYETKNLFAFTWTGDSGEADTLGDAQEFHRGDFEGEPLIAFSADIRGCFTLDRYYPW
jgi:hypothetical protein